MTTSATPPAAVLAALENVEDQLRSAEETLQRRQAPQRVLAVVLSARDDARRARAAFEPVP